MTTDHRIWQYSVPVQAVPCDAHRKSETRCISKRLRSEHVEGCVLVYLELLQLPDL